jgi:hypothetical protein
MSPERIMESYAPLVIVLFWVVMCRLIARVGGWRALAETYPADMPFTGAWMRFQSGQMRYSLNYSGMLSVAADRQGLRLSVFLLFRIGHPDLFIPWSQVRGEVQTGILPGVKLRFERHPGVFLAIGKPLADKLAALSGGRFTLRSA